MNIRSDPTSTRTTKMFAEVREIPISINRLIEDSETVIIGAANELRSVDPVIITTVARGSSDHAAAYLKYAIELLTGIPVASMGPSIASIYGATLRLKNAASISISQSGKSPDIVQMTEAAGEGGALTIAITNVSKSPLSSVSAHTIDIQAGLEKSVAATKTFVTSIVAGLLLIAHWQNDQKLLDAIRKLPDQAKKAIDCDWGIFCNHMKNKESLFILGRGPAMAIANEAALKFKETCQIHAQAYSSAEVMHGPKSIVDVGFPVLALASRDASEISLLKVADSLSEQGADLFITSDKTKSDQQLPFVASGHALTDPLLLILCYYNFIEKLARLKGLNPDEPPHLKKVTETV